jgi:hypothetical protein
VRKAEVLVLIQQKGAEPETEVASGEPPPKRIQTSKPDNQGQVMVEIQLLRPKPLGSGNRGVDLCTVVELINGLMKVRVGIQKEIWSHQKMAELMCEEMDDIKTQLASFLVVVLNLGDSFLPAMKFIESEF